MTSRRLAFLRGMRPPSPDARRPGGELRSAACSAIDASVSVSVATNLHDEPTVYHHWYADGVYVGMTRAAARGFQAAVDDALQIDCRPTRWRDYNPTALLPVAFPPTRVVRFITGADVSYYLVQAATGESPTEDDWATIARVRHDGRWEYRAPTPALLDGVVYQWRVIAVGRDDVEAAPVTLGREPIVTRPPPPANSWTAN